MSTTLYRIDGVKLASGAQAYGSKEMAAWLPVYLRYMREIHHVALVVIKVADLTATIASAGTHLRGYATDMRTWNLTPTQMRLHIYHSTRLGQPGHGRTKAQGFDPHWHGMLDVDYTTPCSYQLEATRRGRDGLARNGPDLDKADRPPQAAWLGYAAGIKQMLTELTPPPPPVDPLEDWIMTTAETKLRAIVRDEITTALTKGVWGRIFRRFHGRKEEMTASGVLYTIDASTVGIQTQLVTLQREMGRTTEHHAAQLAEIHNLLTELRR